jgi:hypothetical protein
MSSHQPQNQNPRSRVLKKGKRSFPGLFHLGLRAHRCFPRSRGSGRQRSDEQGRDSEQEPPLPGGHCSVTFPNGRGSLRAILARGAGPHRFFSAQVPPQCSPRTGELRLAAQRRRSGCLRTRHQQRRSWRSIRIMDPTTHSRYGPSVCCLARRHAPPLCCSHTCHRPRRLRPAAAAGDSAPRRRARPPRRHATLRRRP